MNRERTDLHVKVHGPFTVRSRYHVNVHVHAHERVFSRYGTELHVHAPGTELVQSEQIECPQCNKLFNTSNGLLTHQRFSKKCNTTISTEIINSNNITFRRKQ